MILKIKFSYLKEESQTPGPAVAASFFWFCKDAQWKRPGIPAVIVCLLAFRWYSQPAHW